MPRIARRLRWRRRPRFSELEYGTVPYHLAYARSAARLGYSNAALIALLALFITLPSSVWWIRPVDLGIALFTFRNFLTTRATARENRMKAWEIEINETIKGMAMSGGVFTPEDAVQALASSPPPGIKKKHWESVGDDIRRLHPNLFPVEPDD